MLSALYPAIEHKERVTHYQPFEKELNWAGIKFPSKAKDVSKFEELNPELAVFVWTYVKEKGKRYLMPWRQSKKIAGKEICLLLLQSNKKKHFFLI